jgi:hypothetical protein
VTAATHKSTSIADDGTRRGAIIDARKLWA